ncbi:MAG: hypothetical protein H0V68_11940 [Actinobacteria bacterium]|nr:hypothetical protein [Actinomycetota bacterium]
MAGDAWLFRVPSRFAQLPPEFHGPDDVVHPRIEVGSVTKQRGLFLRLAVVHDVIFSHCINASGVSM